MPRVTEITQESFDPSVLQLYWNFLTERQRIWLRRTNGVERPWTEDPILQVEFITNVYRELDPGTEYLIQHILSADASDEAKVFNIMLYRLMGSVPATHEQIGFLDPANYSGEAVIAKLAEMPDDYRIFGDAYRVASYTDEGGDNKLSNVANMFGYLAEGMDETVRRIKASRRVVEVYKVFEVMKGFGEFLAHQIVVDLLYTNVDGQKIVPFTDDEFAKPGPGCRKGIWSMMAEGIKPANLTIVLEWLRDNQYEGVGDGFPYLMNVDGSAHYMSLCDIQASLCEFHKYYRLYNGERKVQVRKYDGPHRVVTSRPTVLPENYIARVLAMPSATGAPDLTLDEVEDAITGEDEFEALSEAVRSAPPEPLHIPTTSTASLSLMGPDGHPINITININVG